MWRWQQLLTAFYLLPFATLDSCLPTLHVSQLPVGGSRAAFVLPPAGCDCDKLKISVHTKKVNGYWQACEDLEMERCKWVPLPLPSSANSSLVLEGWHRPTAYKCRCKTDSVCTNVTTRGNPSFVPGLRLHDWNATVSAEPPSEGRLSVQVVRQFGADADAGRVFFRQLEISVFQVSNSLRHPIATRDVNCSGGENLQSTMEDGRCLTVRLGGGSAFLLPGSYEVWLKPNVPGTPLFCGWKRRVPVEVPAISDLAPFTPAQPGHDSLLPLLFLLPILSVLLLAFVAFMTWRMWGRRTRSDQGLSDLGTVLLLPAHNRVPELGTIKTYLQKLGARTRDFQEWDVFRAFQNQSCVPAVLELPALRDARVVFVCAERDAPPLRSPAAELWDSVLRFVRNWRPTELVVLTTARGLGPETAGLAAARAFVVPGDLDKLARYLRETNTSDVPLSLSPPHCFK